MWSPRSRTRSHPFRVAIVCAMWLTGFDVECLSTLYIDKPMKAHTLMQAIARANRVYPGKDFGLIVDYNGMLKSLREALAHMPSEKRVAAGKRSWLRSRKG
jgi:type I restriction enzyme R subunit